MLPVNQAGKVRGNQKGSMPLRDAKPRPSHARFAPTRWSIVLQAKAGNEEALADLCAAYWYPAYAFVRRSGTPPEQAKDVVQAFFAHRVLSGAFLAHVDPGQGTFRSWFAQSLRHFVLSHVERENARKRGGDAVHVAMDEVGWDEAEARYCCGLVDNATPERLFDRALGVALVNRALAALGREYGAVGKRAVFDSLAPLLAARGDHGSHTQLAARLGMSEGSVRVALTRFRQRFGQALLEEVLQTVKGIEEARAELAALLQAWAEAGSPLEPAAKV